MNAKHAHLTNLPSDAAVIAFHANKDICAVRVGEEERLYINGEHVRYNLHAFHAPVQIVINLCSRRVTKAQLAKLVAELKASVS